MFLFDYINSIYTIIKIHPLPKAELINIGLVSKGKHSIYIYNSLTPFEFFSLRGILALIGDLYFLIKETKKLSKYLDNEILFDLISNYLPKLKKFRYARNYFAHFDERIGKGREIHGVTGKLKLHNLGIKFNEDSDGCFYLALIGDKLYYHDKQKFEKNPTPKSISINKESLKDIFFLAKDLYDLVTTHSIHPTKYRSSKLLFYF